MAQNYSSKGTSINKTKLPAVYRKVGDKALRGMRVLEYGCGRYTDHIREHLEKLQSTPYFFDPYNLPEEENQKTLNVMNSWMYQIFDTVPFNVVICSNVLNVIDDDETVNEIIRKLVRNAIDVYITVYEGDKTGKGRQTGPDQYQRNEKASAYVERILKLGYWAELKNGVIHVMR